MEISKGISAMGAALWLRKEKIIVINDLHLGYEGALHHKGILVPRFQLEEILEELTKIIKITKPATIIINGDLKHEFGRVLRQEWRDVLQFLDFCLEKIGKVFIIKGNHDPLLPSIAQKKMIQVVPEYQVKNTLLIHGDEVVTTTAKRLIIGHEHPAITIHDGSKREKFKCFLKGKWKGKEVIAVPSFNPLLEGTDVLKEEVLSPFLKNIRNFEVYVVGKEKVLYFGKVKEIQVT